MKSIPRTKDAMNNRIVKLNGRMSMRIPRAASPERPPRPKPCFQIVGGICVARKIVLSARKTGIKVAQLSNRLSPMCRIKRQPHVKNRSGKHQDAQPMAKISFDAMLAPNEPSMFCAGVDVAENQLGSVGE